MSSENLTEGGIYDQLSCTILASAFTEKLCTGFSEPSSLIKDPTCGLFPRRLAFLALVQTEFCFSRSIVLVLILAFLTEMKYFS